MWSVRRGPFFCCQKPNFMVNFITMKRPPIVVVMGHVDHGKTSLLDQIRKANVAVREAGGITQSIGAYEIEHNGERITFIDTPGHQAFSQMRVRGAKIADVAILVVAVDDSVQEQTKEAIKVLEHPPAGGQKTPFIIAITKIDKANIDINKTKNDLMAAGVLLEGYGGNVSWKGVSAKTGEGVSDLLDLILLTAEVEDLKYEPNNPGRGFVLESKSDSRRGVTATVIVTDGKLKVGDEVCVGSVPAKIKSLENFLNKPIKEAMPSAPVLVMGFKEVPKIGEELLVGGELVVPKVALAANQPRPLMAGKDSRVVINLILKADSSGSLEALSAVIKSLPLPANHELNVISEGIGEISDGDVKWRPNIIIGFRVGAGRAADDLAKVHEVRIMTSEIIYDLVKQLDDWMKGIGQKVVSGDLEILAVFGKKGGDQQIVGGKVASGEVKNNSAFEVQRGGKGLGVGRIVNLQQQKRDAIKVEAGGECGLLIKSEVEIRAGDHLIFN